MGLRKVKFVNDEYYHIYNRGVDKRTIFQDVDDLDRFFLSMSEFNVLDPIGSIYLLRCPAPKSVNSNLVPNLNNREKLVEFICYCLNPNHYHFLIKQLTEKGIERFMHKLNGGYSKYFNAKYKRSGSLFEGRFKAIHIDSETYLIHLSAYINLNYRVHNLEKFGGLATKLFKSSWEEYLGLNQEKFCQKDIILDQFDTIENYKKFAEESLERIKERKEMKKFLLDD